MTQATLKVEGMTCDHCVQTVTGAVKSLPGIEKVSVDLGAKQVQVSYDGNQVEISAIEDKIKEAGYEVLKD